MTFEAATLVPGRAEGPVRHLREPLSFWGGYDAAAGTVIDRWHPDHGASCAGMILVMRASRGSSSGSSVLAEALRAGTGPAGIVLLERDAILAIGAMVAAELYGRDCPVVIAREADWTAITEAARLHLSADATGARITIP